MESKTFLVVCLVFSSVCSFGECKDSHEAEKIEKDVEELMSRVKNLPGYVKKEQINSEAYKELNMACETVSEGQQNSKPGNELLAKVKHLSALTGKQEKNSIDSLIEELRPLVGQVLEKAKLIKEGVHVTKENYKKFQADVKAINFIITQISRDVNNFAEKHLTEVDQQ
ncbi:hypothetical protein DdX_15652 [Ditylenchus destructor]|uniref:Uncharacterized protein n=1 Tax=Ditylenchus destructor TaxID=166010 RepID=A0AAD4MUY2_9BILA|nr:hypothetical protein DdX_15652 [Ditylenchus destructor]